MRRLAGRAGSRAPAAAEPVARLRSSCRRSTKNAASAPCWSDRREGDAAAAAAGSSCRAARRRRRLHGRDGRGRRGCGLDGLFGRLRLLRLDRNRGKGAAVRAGMLAAAATRAAHRRRPLHALWRSSSAVRRDPTWARTSRSARAVSRVRVVGVQQRVVPRATRQNVQPDAASLTGLPYRDTQCGFKLFRLETARAIFERQRVNGFAFDAELCVLARRLGLTTVEVPVRWATTRARTCSFARPPAWRSISCGSECSRADAAVPPSNAGPRRPRSARERAAAEVARLRCWAAGVSRRLGAPAARTALPATGRVSACRRS